MRLGQSAAAAATPTRALPLATSTEIVAFHAAEKRSDDQWYKSMSRSSPASATHVLKKVFAADPQAPPTSRVGGRCPVARKNKKKENSLLAYNLPTATRCDLLLALCTCVGCQRRQRLVSRSEHDLLCMHNGESYNRAQSSNAEYESSHESRMQSMSPRMQSKHPLIIIGCCILVEYQTSW